MAVPSSAASTNLSTLHSHSLQKKPTIPTTVTLQKRLLRKGVNPTPKILHNLHKKETQKALRREKKEVLKQQTPPLTEAQKEAIAEHDHFRTIRTEYKEFRKELVRGRPWERGGAANLNPVLGFREDTENLVELRDMLKERNRVKFQWLLEDDLELNEEEEEERKDRDLDRPKKRVMGDDQKIKFLVKNLASLDTNDLHDWRFLKLIEQSDIIFDEANMLKILEGLKKSGNWRQALSIVQWVYNQKKYKHKKSRFVYTKLLTVLGKARRGMEALQIFKYIRRDDQIFPDLDAYHSIAMTLGQCGLENELLEIIDLMREKYSEKVGKRNWGPSFEPDLIVYNAVIKSCLASARWKRVFWVFDKMKDNCIEPNSASYSLAMEVMLNAGKYDSVHEFFERMRKNGLATQAITYKIMVKCYAKEGRINEAINTVREMETKSITGQSIVYYELACILCRNGQWQNAILEVENMKKLPRTKPLECTFTGMILSSFEGGYVENSLLIFEFMKKYCNPNIETINAMLRVYSNLDMFSKAKDLFENINLVFGIKPDIYTYNSMLETCASSLQWEYFEFVYREMVLNGFELDQRKYGSFIIQASKNGKFILLEHAFNNILERGEIPEIPIFVEMICQTISQDNFERTLTMINCMAHASLKVYESQWTNILRENIDMFRKDSFHDLLEYINGHHIVSEEPALSFIKSLEYLSSYEPRSLIQEPPKTGLELGKLGEKINYYLNFDYDYDFDSNGSAVDQVIDSLDVGDIFKELPSAEEILEMWNEEGE